MVGGKHLEGEEQQKSISAEYLIEAITFVANLPKRTLQSWLFVSLLTDGQPQQHAPSRRAMIRPATGRLVHQPRDLYAGSVITQRAHRELKRIMRFVNKMRRPFWQPSTCLASSAVSSGRCECEGAAPPKNKTANVSCHLVPIAHNICHWRGYVPLVWT